MSLFSELKNRVLLCSLFIRSICRKILHMLGWSESKYGMCAFTRYKGLWFFPQSTIGRIQAVEKYENFRPDDVVLLTYPKSGTHLTMEIVTSVYKEAGLQKLRHPLDNFHPLEIGIPMFLIGLLQAGDSLTDVDAMHSPRMLWTHLPWNFLPARIREGNVKLVGLLMVIYTMRNPKDVVCSSFSFMKRTSHYSSSTSWPDFLTWFIQGNVVYGSYFNHLKRWYPNRKHPNMLTLHFEDMIKDLEVGVEQVAAFLNISLTPEQVCKVADECSFEKKRRELGLSNPFYRKGISGGWRSEFTVAQSQMFDEWIDKEMEEIKLKWDY